MKQSDEEIVGGLIKRFAEATCESKRYSYPRLINLGGIKTIIVDPHNEVLPFWYLNGRPPATLVHIDKHSDTTDFSESLESLLKNEEELGRVCNVAYSKYYQTPGSFISAAIFYELISDFYWINLREDSVLRIGRRYDRDLKKLVTEADGKIVWDVNYHPRLPPAVELSENEMISEIDPTKPLILDIDLDAFECVEDKDYMLRKYLSLGLYTLLNKPLGNFYKKMKKL